MAKVACRKNVYKVNGLWGKKKKKEKNPNKKKAFSATMWKRKKKKRTITIAGLPEQLNQLKQTDYNSWFS